MSKRKLDPLLLAGERMSNMCFNLSQRDNLDQSTRQMMRELVTEWDFARRSLKAAERKRPKLTQESKKRKARP